MKNKIVTVIILFTVILICHQIYWYKIIGGNLSILISNHSRNDTKIELFINEEKVVNEKFTKNSFINYKNYSFNLFPRTHKLVIRSENGIQKQLNISTFLVKRVVIEYRNKESFSKQIEENEEFFVLTEPVYKDFVIQ